MALLLALLLPAQAQALAEPGLGPTVGYTSAGGLAGGFSIAPPNEDTVIRFLFGPKDEEGRVLREWTLEVGHWGPSLDEDAPDVPLDLGDGAELPETPDQDILVAVPHLLVGGDLPGEERFVFAFDIDGLLDLPAIAKVPASTFYAGPMAGAGVRVAYATRETGGQPVGGVRVGGGAAMGVAVADVFDVRLIGDARVDPFVGGGTLRAGALLGLSLLRAGAPMGLSVAGEVERGLESDAALAWTLRGTLLYLLPDTDDDDDEDI